MRCRVSNPCNTLNLIFESSHVFISSEPLVVPSRGRDVNDYPSTNCGVFDFPEWVLVSNVYLFCRVSRLKDRSEVLRKTIIITERVMGRLCQQESFIN